MIKIVAILLAQELCAQRAHLISRLTQRSCSKARQRAKKRANLA